MHHIGKSLLSQIITTAPCNLLFNILKILFLVCFYCVFLLKWSTLRIWHNAKVMIRLQIMSIFVSVQPRLSTEATLWLKCPSLSPSYISLLLLKIFGENSLFQWAIYFIICLVRHSKIHLCIFFSCDVVVILFFFHSLFKLFDNCARISQVWFQATSLI